ncbi:MAG: TonB-dependent siderophore receptor [Burkholderiaceae bacterium]|nr:TonB-dependent siderophore receptor [Burkholderiaceae bacterium]
MAKLRRSRPPARNSARLSSRPAGHNRPPVPPASPTGTAPVHLLPLGAMLLAGSLSAFAQETGKPAESTLPTVTVKAAAEVEEDRDTLRAVDSTIGKGKQALRDIPQSLTVVTEKLMTDRNLDTLAEALKNTAGISFLAAEGGEEDIRLRGFSLQASGDIYVDAMRDPAFYSRDTFNFDRIEVLRGSASMLFGRGSTGGVVNQVSKVPRLINENQANLTLGSYGFVRAEADLNVHTGESSALRLNAMANTADSDGAGNSIRKAGIAGAYRWGIGERDEFTASLFYLENQNGINYGLPWIRPSPTSPASDTTLLPLDPKNYYGMASDVNNGSAGYGTFSHLHRFDADTELRTQVRAAKYTRDQRASAIRLCRQSTANPDCPANVTLENFDGSTQFTRGTNLKIQDLQTLVAQSDYATTFDWGGMRHQFLAGVDYAGEKKQVYSALSAAQGGVTLSKPLTSAGTPDDGAWVDEAARVLRTSSEYSSQAIGVYAQDLVQVAPFWKVLGGLRYDYLVGDYDTYSIPNNAASPTTPTRYQMKVSQWSGRLGLMYQPTPLSSYYASVANSFNTSGDAYSLSAANVDIPPEQSVNMEIGAKIDSDNKRFTTRVAAFWTNKYQERNTDPDVNLVTLSGKRHAAGLELDLSGRLTSRWEMYSSMAWIPIANIDEGVPGSEGEGTRPSLTPLFSGTVWTTCQMAPRWRVGGGLNFATGQTPNRNPGWEVPGYVTGDLMLEYVASESVAIKANLNNVTNELYVNAVYSGHYVPGPGRTLQVTATLKF